MPDPDRTARAVASPPTASVSRSPRRGRTIALALLLVVATLFAISHMDQGIDTWISLAGGRDVVAHGVRDQDPFSFNSRPPTTAEAGTAHRIWSWLSPDGWINQNWLTHVLLYGLQQAGGLDALVWWKAANYLLVALVLVVASRRLGASPVAAVIVTAAALAVSRDYLSIRAQDVTNLLAAALVLVIALVHTRGPRWAWALVPLLAVWANAHGGYVFGLVVLAILVATSWFDGRRRGWAGEQAAQTTALLALTSGLSLAACVVASPYRLANLTHPLVITASAEAPLWRVVREWGSLFANPLSSPYPFLAFTVGAVVALLVASPGTAGRRRHPAGSAGPTLVLAVFLLAVAAARFVPLACITAVPFYAVWLDCAGRRVVRTPSGALSRSRLTALAGDVAIWALAVGVAAAFSLRASGVFVGPWPQDPDRTGLFDRLTHAHQRPWGACAFLAANGVAGRMWNFWDEGGFLAACQHPDPASGSPPVQIFIDGRAQAAYNVDALASYLDLLNGPGRSGGAGASTTQVSDIDTLRPWTAGRLRELGVWIALISAGRQGTAFAQAAAALPGWQLAYIDDEHNIVVDGESAGGRALLARLESGTLRFPNAASERLTAAFRLLPRPDEDSQLRAVEAARSAFAGRPSSLAVLCAVRAGRAPAARQEARRFCREVAEDFTANHERYRDASGFALRLDAAVTALDYLASEARTARDAATLRWAGAWLERCRTEQDANARRVLW